MSNEITKRYYTITEVSKILNVNASLVRFWEKEFTQIKPKKGRKGNRLFTPADLAVLNQIYDLVKVNGYTLEGARKALKKGVQAPKGEHHEVKLKLTKIKRELLALHNSISA